MSYAASHAQAVQAAIESIGGVVSMARALVLSGRQVDLQGLDREATAVCAAVMVLAVPEAKLLRPSLEVLLRQVNELTAEIARD